MRRFLKEMDRDLERIKEKQQTSLDGGMEEVVEEVLEVAAGREQVVYDNFNKDTEGI